MTHKHATAVFPAMGTMISVRTPEELPEPIIDAVRGTFEAWERRYSPFLPGSELSAVSGHRLPIAAATPEFRRTYDAALRWRVTTMGAFDPTTPEGTIDLNGIVKALAIHAAGCELTASGRADWCLNAGGDVLVSGTQDGEPWIVGIVDPDDRTALLSAVAMTEPRRAVATSGYAERGAHIRSPRPPRTDDTMRFSQVTVVANDIVTADVLATAILAGGPETLTQMERLTDIEVLAVGPDGLCWAAEVFRRASPVPAGRW